MAERNDLPGSGPMAEAPPQSGYDTALADLLRELSVEGPPVGRRPIDTTPPPAFSAHSYDPTLRDRLATYLAASIGGDRPLAPETRRLTEGLLGSTGIGHSSLSLADVAPFGPGYWLDAATNVGRGDYGAAATDAAKAARVSVPYAIAGKALQRGQDVGRFAFTMPEIATLTGLGGTVVIPENERRNRPWGGPSPAYGAERETPNLSSFLRDEYSPAPPPSAENLLARYYGDYDGASHIAQNPLLRLAQAGPTADVRSPEDARWMRERNIQLDRENTASGYYGHFSEPELLEYLTTGREPRDIMQRMEVAAAEKEAARRPPRRLPPPSSEPSHVPALPPPASREASGQDPSRNQLVELLASKPLDQMHFTDYLKPGAGHPRTPQEQARVIEQLKASRYSDDPEQRYWAEQFVDRYGSLPFGIAANTATHGWSDWLMSRTSNPTIRGHLVGIDPPNEYPRQAFPFPVYEEGELRFARDLAQEFNPYQNALAKGVGYATPIGIALRIAKLLRSAPPLEEVPSSTTSPTGKGLGPWSDGSSTPRTQTPPGRPAAEAEGWGGTSSGIGRYARPPQSRPGPAQSRPGQSDASPSSSEPTVEFKPFDPRDPTQIISQRPLSQPRGPGKPRVSKEVLRNPTAHRGGRPPDDGAGGQGGAPMAHQYEVDENELLRLLLQQYSGPWAP